MQSETEKREGQIGKKGKERELARGKKEKREREERREERERQERKEKSPANMLLNQNQSKQITALPCAGAQNPHRQSCLSISMK